jgi:hypothetical protein
LDSSQPFPSYKFFFFSNFPRLLLRYPVNTSNISENGIMKKTGIKNSILCFALLSAMGVAHAGNMAATNTPGAIPWNEIGAKAGADYKGDGLAVTPTESGAHLHCVFQRLDGEATSEGLWLTSTVTNTVSDRFRVTAMEVGRIADGPLTPSLSPSDGERVADSPGEGQLPRTGSVSVCGQMARFSRPGLTEEYSVSMDGVRQDFIVEQAPPSPPGGELVVKLAVSGAQVEPAADGARLVLANSGRKIAYSRLRVTDGTGKELPARIEVWPVGDEETSFKSWSDTGNLFEELSLLTPAPARKDLAVVVNDANAVYPVRIDPTFSDANWVSMGVSPGANGSVFAAAVDGSGNLYIGGDFTVVGNTLAANVAEWNGSSWSALGSGMNSTVFALVLSGSTLYAGGYFTTAGGTAANVIAQWNGSSWSALGSGMDGPVDALAVSGSTLYAGGSFSYTGDSSLQLNYIAQWNGSSWSALGSGMSGGDGNGPYVLALAVSGSTLYVGGDFTTAGGSTANYIAQWNGSSWSPFGSGISGGGGDARGPYVAALAVSGSTLYVGGDFTTAGTNISAYAAMANLAATPGSVAIIANNEAFGFTNGVFGFDLSGPSGSNVVIQASSNLQTWIPLQTNLLGSGPLYFSDSQSPANVQRFYRAQLLP